MLSIGVGASLMFCHPRSRFVRFICICTCSDLGPSCRWSIGFIHVAPRWMRGLSHPAHDFTDCTRLPINVAICIECCCYNMWTFCIVVMSEVLCFKGCISRSAVKSSGIWEATHPITSGLPPGVTLNGVFYNKSQITNSIHILWLPGRLGWHNCIESHMPPGTFIGGDFTHYIFMN